MAAPIVLSPCGWGSLPCKVLVMGLCGVLFCFLLHPQILSPLDASGEAQVAEPGAFVLCLGDDSQPNRSLWETAVSAITMMP